MGLGVNMVVVMVFFYFFLLIIKNMYIGMI